MICSCRTKYFPRDLSFKNHQFVIFSSSTHTRKLLAGKAQRDCVLSLVVYMYRVLVGKPEGRRPMGRPRRRWVDNIRTDLQEVGCGYMDWIGLAQDRDRWRTPLSAVMNLRVP